MTQRKKVFCINLGKTEFTQAWNLQKIIHKYKSQNDYTDFLLFTEHEKIYTLGKSGTKNHLLMNEEEMKQKGVSFIEIDRGGDITFHGPGQLVCYPVFDLKHFYSDTHKFLRDLEETVILSLKEFGILSGRDEGNTGVWADNEKICAIGIKVSKWVTMHGLALNVNNELDYFNRIIPCGIFDKGVTSMKKITGTDYDMNNIIDKIEQSFCQIFNLVKEEFEMEKLTQLFNGDFF
jgi:lipoyl(octanoyl) transferase